MQTSIVRKRTNLVSVIQKHSVNKFSCIGATNAWEVERASVSGKGGLEIDVDRRVAMKGIERGLMAIEIAIT